jgi:hypothetical protein
VITRHEVLVEGHGQQSPFGPNTWLAQTCSGLPSHKLGWRYFAYGLHYSAYDRYSAYPRDKLRSNGLIRYSQFW